MKVVIFCGGLGARLREETEFRPKPMVEIGGKPILWHIMKIYAHYGFKEFVLCLGYKGEMIKEYFYQYYMRNSDFTVRLGGVKDSIEIHQKEENLDWKVTLVDTGLSALKGARLKRIEKFIDTDTFMLTYGDGVADVNIPGLLKFHRSHRRVATLCGVRPSSRFGEIKVKGSKVVSFDEKPQISTGLINGGFFVLQKNIFKLLKNHDDQDFEYDVLQQLARKGELQVHKHKGQWECMDTYRDVQHLNKLWQEKQAFWKVWTDE